MTHAIPFEAPQQLDLKSILLGHGEVKNLTILVNVRWK
jgi:hypothetical protein